MLCQIGSRNARDHDYQQNLTQVPEISDQLHDRAAKKVSGATENKHPGKAATERHQQEARITHAPDAIENAGSPALSVNILRQKNCQRPKLMCQTFQARRRAAIKASVAPGFSESPPQSISQVVAGNTAE